MPTADDFATTYARLGDPELIEIARAYDSLTSPAQDALRSEFSRRGLDPPLIEDDEESVPEHRRLVTVQRFRDLSEAIVARSYLGSAGLHVYLYDENLVRLDWQVSNFIGGIRLQVEVSDAPAAIDLLTQPVPPRFSFGGLTDFAQPVCPVCASTEITFQGASRAAALTSLYVLSLPLPPGPETWVCDLCGARWENTSPPDPYLES